MPPDHLKNIEPILKTENEAIQLLFRELCTTLSAMDTKIDHMRTEMDAGFLRTEEHCKQRTMHCSALQNGMKDRIAGLETQGAIEQAIGTTVAEKACLEMGAIAERVIEKKIPEISSVYEKIIERKFSEMNVKKIAMPAAGGGAGIGAAITGAIVWLWEVWKN